MKKGDEIIKFTIFGIPCDKQPTTYSNNATYNHTNNFTAQSHNIIFHSYTINFLLPLPSYPSPLSKFGIIAHNFAYLADNAVANPK